MLTSRREDFLCRCETIDNGGGFMDCLTLKLCVTLTSLQWMALIAFPKFFHQLYAVHGYVNGHYIPLVHCLSDKSTATCAYVEHDTSQLCSYDFLFCSTLRCYRFWKQHVVGYSVSSPQCFSTLLQISSGASMVASHEQNSPRAELQGQIFRRSTLASVIFVWTVISTSERSSDAFTDDIMLNNPPF